jgi:hypothetical protein
MALGRTGTVTVLGLALTLARERGRCPRAMEGAAAQARTTSAGCGTAEASSW